METLHRRLTEIRGTSPDSYRVFVVLNYIALIAIAAHTLLVPLFAWMGVGSMALFNVVGCAIWVLAFLWNRNGRHSLGFILGFAEVVAHSFLGVAILGWGSGFQYHILPAVLFILIHPMWRGISRVLVPILLCALYVALNLYSRTVGPMVAADPAALNLLNALNVIVLFVALSVFAHKYRMAVRTGEQELKEANRELDVLAGTDSLTGLLNRRHMRQRIEIEMARFERTGKSFALVMADIDDFKSFNDRHGHECGDRVLVSVSNLMKESLRRRDQLARWGGEEFLMLLPETGLQGGGAVAERIRQTIESTSFSHNGSGMSISMTFGVSICGRGQGMDDCINKADRAMYAARRRGKNSVALSGDELPQDYSATH